MKKIIGILGLGLFGSAIAQTLAENDYDVIAVDKNSSHVNELSPYITKGVVGDITDLDLLETIGISDCDTVVVSTGTVLEASVLAVMHCKKLGIPEIIVKAKNSMYKEVLMKIGATQVILPEFDTGVRLAKKLMRNSIHDIFELDDKTSIIEFEAPPKWIGKNLRELDLRNRYEINIIGMRTDKDAPVNVGVLADTVVEKDIILLGLTESDYFERQDYLEEPID